MCWGSVLYLVMIRPQCSQPTTKCRDSRDGAQHLVGLLLSHAWLGRGRNGLQSWQKTCRGGHMPQQQSHYQQNQMVSDSVSQRSKDCKPAVMQRDASNGFKPIPTSVEDAARGRETPRVRQHRSSAAASNPRSFSSGLCPNGKECLQILNF